MFGIIREGTSRESTVNALAILHGICMWDPTKQREVSEDENLNRTIYTLAQSGHQRASEKAQKLLRLLWSIEERERERKREIIIR